VNQSKIAKTKNSFGSIHRDRATFRRKIAEKRQRRFDLSRVARGGCIRREPRAGIEVDGADYYQALLRRFRALSHVTVQVQQQ
jgi:hypothetical protein